MNGCKKPLFSLLFLLLCLFQTELQGQYTLNEVGVQAGGGYVSATSDFSGAGASLEGYWSHYFCGKRYGIHATGGLSTDFLSREGIANESFAGAFGDLSLNLLHFNAGFYFKIRAHEYHRPKEVAFFVGPKISVPLWGNLSGPMIVGNLNVGDAMDKVVPVVPRIHASVQMRRPMGKSSWFIVPSVEYSLIPEFETQSNSIQRLHLMLSFAFDLWDFRG